MEKKNSWYMVGGAVAGLIVGALVAVGDYLWDGKSNTVLFSLVSVDAFIVGAGTLSVVVILWTLGVVGDRWVLFALVAAPAALASAFVMQWGLPLLAGLAAVLGFPVAVAGKAKSIVQSAIDDVMEQLKKKK